MNESQRYCVRAGDVVGYHPANHTGTLNKRLIGPETVGAKRLEVVLGVVEKGRGAVREDAQSTDEWPQDRGGGQSTGL